MLQGEDGLLLAIASFMAGDFFPLAVCSHMTRVAFYRNFTTAIFNGYGVVVCVKPHSCITVHPDIAALGGFESVTRKRQQFFLFNLVQFTDAASFSPD